MVVQGIPTQTRVRLWLAWRQKNTPVAVLGNQQESGRVLHFMQQPVGVLYEFEGLMPGSEYTARFIDQNNTEMLPPVTCTTLPAALDANKDFSIAIGSCYWFHSNARKLLPESYPPKVHDVSLRFLLGDQIYIDVFGPSSIPSPLVPDVGALYRKQWQDQDFVDFLARTPTGVLLDDHDYWNDYPHNNAQLPYLYLPGVRPKLAAEAKQGIDAFQLPLNLESKPNCSFAVEPLQFFLLDTRTSRSRFDHANPRFIEPEVKDSVIDWLHTLQGPAVLAIANSLVANSTPSFWRFLHMMGDVSLADYPNDYFDLWKAIIQAPHDLLLLTGDVHYSAFGVVDVKMSPYFRPNWRRGLVYECISSALGLLPSARSSYDQPQKFDISGYDDRGENLSYHNIHAGLKGQENYAVLSFRRFQDGVEFTVRYYAPNGTLLFAPQPGAKYVLQ